ncbi:MAG: ubiquinol-cytochrome C chaperone family protein [Alphaproteobacteria bacterium]|nr:ubiquinol-cytochrome C chaperone family protein [Alphaproteobacteria bacterium]
MLFRSMYRRRGLQRPAEAVYGALVAQARRPWFYRELGVPDTVEGRFEMISLHAFLVLNRLKAARRAGVGRAEDLGQAVFDLMFADMDRNLREMGTGDLGVAKRVKGLIKGFYGRAKAYEDGLAAGRQPLVAAIERNVYGGTAPNGSAGRLAAYLEDSVTRLEGQAVEALEAGELRFGALGGACAPRDPSAAAVT